MTEKACRFLRPILLSSFSIQPFPSLRTLVIMLCSPDLSVAAQACVYGVAAILWATAKFSLSANQKLAMPRQLKRLLMEMAKRTPIERPSIVMAKKVRRSSSSSRLKRRSFTCFTFNNTEQHISQHTFEIGHYFQIGFICIA